MSEDPAPACRVCGGPREWWNFAAIKIAACFNEKCPHGNHNRESRAKLRVAA